MPDRQPNLPPTLNHILVPIDFQEPAEQALELAISLAVRFDAQLTLLHVALPPTMEGIPELHWRTEDWLETIQDQLEERLARVRVRHGRSASVLTVGVADKEILNAIGRYGASMVVMGTRDRGAVAHMWSGSVAAKVVRHARVPVLTVHAPPSHCGSANAA
jgi:nucleotide-binding universal stress UspA family protein